MRHRYHSPVPAPNVDSRCECDGDEPQQCRNCDDYREAYYWLRQNTHPTAKVMSWWDYGYQIGGMADRPTLVDNNTWNNTHIATVGKAMSSREDLILSWTCFAYHQCHSPVVIQLRLYGLA